MKKSLNALILCGLASLMILTAVFASPVSVKAVPSTETTAATVEPLALDGNGLVPIQGTSVTGTVDITYPYGAGLIDSGSGAALFVDPDGSIGILLASLFTNNVLNEVITFDYSISYLGSTYTGSVSITAYDEHDNLEIIYVVYGNIGASGYGQAINDLKNLIGNISKDSTLTGENRVVEFNEGTALPKSVISSLANSENVTLKFTFVYEGYEFCTTITSEDAKRVYDSKVEWAGPCYLANNFPTVWTGKTVK